ncbi:hypothetical protein BX600DRAFT_405839 [Xylariales sp. PMI_506]|nr:hypothetical protein BX600DRAFT_405839 [Xylariales sp. PMI_506]
MTMNGDDESTPLLRDGKRASNPTFFSPANRILLASILISIALSFTQVPILYAFRLMECEEFYRQENLSDPSVALLELAGQCNRPEIDAGTAAQVSLLGLTTVFFGVLNLFVSGWQIKKWGPKTALVLQTFFPAVRVSIQVLGVSIGARAGIVVIQSSQLVGLIGGVSGYLLVLNTAAGEVVLPSERTAMFGKLQGGVMLGTAVGYLLGGIVGDAFGIGRPFQVATVLFLSSSLYALLFIPYIDPKSLSDGNEAKAKGMGALLAPFRVLRPQKLRLPDGSTIRHSGITFLGLGVFLGVLATGYAPILIQMYATAAFNFGPAENGYLMASNSLIRGIFLIFAFPRIISMGRRWYANLPVKSAVETPEPGCIPTHAEDFDPIQGIMPEQEPVSPPDIVDDEAGREFDLFFLRWSLVADGLVTAYTASATTGWHIYLAGFLLPLASGSAPASKGVITGMCNPAQRADALQAMTLVENVAMLSTLGIFGYVFTAFSDAGKAYLTFYCNAIVALIAVGVLTLSRFLPAGSKIEESDDTIDTVDETRTEEVS